MRRVLPAVYGVFVFVVRHLFSYTRARVSPRVTLAALLAIALAASFTFLAKPAPAQAATASTINFQARLMNASGAIVPDGTYNVEFKLYNSATVTGTPDQGACTDNGGTADPNCLWTETRTGANTVSVQNGYLTVNLGSVTPLPTNIWNQQLWLSMRIGGTGGTPSWDSEMNPRLTLTAVPAAYALTNTNGSVSSSLTLQAPTVGNQSFSILDQQAAGSYNICVQGATNARGGCAPTTGGSGYIQNSTSTQSNANFNIQGASGTVAATIQGASGQDIADFKGSSGTLMVTISQYGTVFAQSGFFSNSNSLSINEITAQPTNTNTSATLTTTNGLYVALAGTNNANPGANVLNGISFANVTAATNNSFYGLNFGTGYSDILRYNGTQLISGSGLLQNAAFDSALNYSNLQKVTSLTATGNLAVQSASNPAGGNALIVANNTNASPSGNLLDLQTNGTSKFSVDTSGNVSASGNLSVGGTQVCTSSGCNGGPATSIPRIEISGHSYAYGVGASSFSTRFTTRLASMLHAQELNHGVGGAVVSYNQSGTGAQGDGGYDYTYQNVLRYPKSAPYLPTPGIGLIEYGINDMAALGPTNFTTPFENGLRAVIARYRTAALFEETDSSIAYGGTWNTAACANDCSGGSSKQPSANGNTVTVTVPADFPGGTVDVGLVATGDGNGAVYNWTVDGSSSGSTDTRNQGAPGRKTGMVKRFTGLGAGTHTIVGTIASLTGSTTFDYWQIEAPTPPLTVVMLADRMYGYNIYSSGWTYQPNDSDVTTVNNAISSVASEFDSSVITVATDSLLNKQQKYFYGDNGHPNDLGQAVIAQALYEAIESAPLTDVQKAEMAGGVDYTGNNAVFRNSNNSTTGFQVQNASFSSLFDVDTTNGRIGIGTNAPTNLLHVYANANGGQGILVENAADGAGNYALQGFRNSGGQVWNTGIGAPSETNLGVANKYFIYDANASKIRLNIDTSGNVGIGTTVQGYQLDVRGSASSQLHVNNADTTAGGYLFGSSAGLFVSGDASYNGSQWVAQAASASLIDVAFGGLLVYGNTGLTSGNAYTPTGILTLDSGGNMTVGNVVSSGTAVAGKLKLGDGTTDNRSITLQSSALTGSYSLALPAVGVAGTSCLQSTSGSTTTVTALQWGSCSGSGTTYTTAALDTVANSGQGIGIQGTTIFLQSASGSNPGAVNTTNQSFAGVKTFAGGLTVTGATVLQEAAAPSATSGYGKLYVSSSDHALHFVNASGTDTALGTSTGLTGVGTYSTTNTNANGATVSGNNIIFQSASTSAPGMVDTGAQTFAGVKTFNDTVATANQTSNLALDPGAEFGGEGMTASGTWSVQTNANVAHSGNKYFQATGSGANVNYIQNNYIPVAGGQSYQVSYWIKKDSGTNGTAGIALYFYNASKGAVFNSSASRGCNLTYSTTWQLCSAHFYIQPSANAVYMRMALQTQSDSTTGNWYIDDIDVTRADTGLQVMTGPLVAYLPAPTITGFTQNTLGTLALGGTYYYQVLSYNANTGNYTSPGPESSVTLTGLNNEVTVNWTPVTGADGYLVERGTASGAEDHSFFVSGGSSSSYTDTGSGSANIGNGFEPNYQNYSMYLQPTGNSYILVNGGNFGIGTNAPAYKLDVAGALRLQPSAAPTAAKGVMYFDSTANKFKCSEDGSTFVNCIGSGSGTTYTTAALDTVANSGQGIGISGSTIFLQSASATNPGAVNTTTQSFGGAKTFTGTLTVAPPNSTTALQVQNSSSATVLAVDTTANQLNLSGNLNLNYVAAPASAPTFNAFVSSGALTGTYYYVVTYVTASGETDYSAASASMSPSAQNVTINIPTSPSSLVTARNIYRGTSSSGPFNLVGTVNNNTATTFTDSNTSPGAAAKDINTTATLKVGGSTVLVADSTNNNTALGISSLQGLTTGHDNTALGWQSLLSNTTGYNNVALGAASMQNATGGYNNVAIGYGGLFTNSTGHDNIAMGWYALTGGAGSNNIALGNSALGATTSASNSIAIGYNALANANAAGNVAIGYQAGLNTTSGTNNTAIGTYALQGNTTGSYNIATGYNALAGNSTGSYNIATGYQTLQFNTSGHDNIATGSYALQSNTTGNNNVASGTFALSSNTTGSNNSTTGFYSMLSNTTGSYNTVSGVNALSSNTTGSNNTASGYQALYNLQTLSGNITATASNGGNAQFTTGSTSGMVAGMSVTISGTTNYNGIRTVLSVDSSTTFTVNVAYVSSQTGSWTANVNNNTAVGYNAGYGPSGYSVQGSALFGTQAGYSLQTGADYNTMLGMNAGYSVTTGAQNLLLGYNAGQNLTTGSNNIIIGAGINAPAATTSYQLDIGDTLYGDMTSGQKNIAIGVNSFYGKLTVAGSVALQELASAPAATSGYGKLYVSSSDHSLHFVNASGTDIALGGSHSKTIRLSAEYPNSVLDAANDPSCSSANTGSMTSGFTGTATIINYMKWTSTSATAQCYDIVIKLQVPSDFSSWNGAPTLAAYSSDGTAAINVETRDTTGALGGNNYTALSPGTATWTTASLSSLTGTYTPGSTMLFRIRLTSSNSNYAQVGDLTLNYTSAY